MSFVSVAGQLLVSPPMMEDPNFAGSVVAVLIHNEEGAFGLVLNQPLDLDLAEIAPQWADRTTPPQLVFQGGPVQTNSMVAVGHALPGRATELPLSLITLDLHRLPADEALDVGEVRLFVGYSGWGPGQLDGEIAMGGWLVLPMHTADVFCPDPTTLWQQVLRRQGGEVAWLSLHPDDIALN